MISNQNSRQVLAITGKDAFRLLQDLVTNDLNKMENGIVYTSLLSPQGKYLFDFFLHRRQDKIILDVASAQATALVQRLSMYKLRSDMEINSTDLKVSLGTEAAPSGSYADPRHSALGWRLYDNEDHSEEVDWSAIRVEHLVPAAGSELISGESYILEYGFERLNGVDFKKGCFVGQEVTARMKHKTALRKGLARVHLSGEAEFGTEITAGDKVVGKLLTRSGNRALAYLRHDRASAKMSAGDSEITEYFVAE